MCVEFGLYEKLIGCIAAPTLANLFFFLPVGAIAVIGNSVLSLPIGIWIAFAICQCLYVVGAIFYAVLKNRNQERLEFDEAGIALISTNKKTQIAYAEIHSIIYEKTPIWLIPLCIVCNAVGSIGFFCITTKLFC